MPRSYVPILRVGRVDVHWEVGKAFIFDDSYEHEVRWTQAPAGREVDLSTTEARVVLIIDFDHPDMTPNGAPLCPSG